MNIKTSERHRELMGLVGEWLTGKRKERGLSLQEMASAAGVSRCDVTNLESGLGSANFTFLFDVLDALGCTWDEVSELFEIDAELRHGGVS